jgi:dTDP-4-dehydrorhamnose reductase
MTASGPFPDPYLVTGASGMLGTALVEVLARSGVECFGMAHNQLDITSPASIARALQALRPGTVINAAAFTDVDGSEVHEPDAFRVNAQGPGHLAEACRKSGLVLIHVSSDYVFDGLRYRPYQEEDPMNPRGAYARSKAQGEHFVRESLPDSHCIVRTQWLFGRKGKNFVRSILDAGQRQNTLRVVHDQYGSPTYTPDLAEAIVRLCRRGCRGTFHVRNSGVTTWFRFAEAILRMAGLDAVSVVPITSARLARPAPRPPRGVLDCSRYEHMTGHKLRHWKDALSEYLKKE